MPENMHNKLPMVQCFKDQEVPKITHHNEINAILSKANWSYFVMVYVFHIWYLDVSPTEQYILVHLVAWRNLWTILFPSFSSKRSHCPTKNKSITSLVQLVAVNTKHTKKLYVTCNYGNKIIISKLQSRNNCYNKILLI